MNIELFKIFSGPIPKGSKEYTIGMNIESGTLILFNWKNEKIEETNAGLLWCQSPQAIGARILEWFKLGFPVESNWAYPATARGAEELGFFIQGAARIAERMSRQ